MAEEKRRSRERGAFHYVDNMYYTDSGSDRHSGLLPRLDFSFSSGLTGVDVPCKRLELVPDFFV